MDTHPPRPLGGRYELGPLLGRGGMADVHRARDTLLDRDVAVKVFRRVDLPAADLRRAGEVQLLAGLSHPGLVTVFDAGRTDDGDFGFLVLELVDGPSLRQRLDDGPLDEATTARIGAEVAAALAYVHSRGIVHRDVKPANILLAPDGSARLTDFGVARLLDAAGQLTVEGTTVGTANYLSPEQASGLPLTGASDVYALGLVLLECRTGTIAFPGSGISAAGARLHRDPDVPPSLGPGWVALLTAMTAREPAARPAAETVTARLTALAAPGVGVAPTQVLTTSTPERRRPGWLAAAIGGTVAAIVALAAVLAITGGGTEGTAGTPTSPRSTPVSSPPSTPRTSHTSSPAPTTSSSRPTTSAASTSAPKPPQGPPGHSGKPPKKPHPPKGGPKKPHKAWSGLSG